MHASFGDGRKGCIDVTYRKLSYFLKKLWHVVAEGNQQQSQCSCCEGGQCGRSGDDMVSVLDGSKARGMRGSRDRLVSERISEKSFNESKYQEGSESVTNLTRRGSKEVAL